MQTCLELRLQPVQRFESGTAFRHDDRCLLALQSCLSDDLETLDQKVSDRIAVG